MLTATLLLASALLAGADTPAVPGVDPPQGHYSYRGYGRIEGLTDPIVTRMLQDSRGYIWAATDDGVFRFDGDRFERIDIERGLPSNTITALYEDSTHRVYAGTAAGLARFNGTDFEAVPLPGKYATSRIYTLAESDHRLWVGTGAGLLSGDSDRNLAPVEEFGAIIVTSLLGHQQTDDLWMAARAGNDAWIARRDDKGWHRIKTPDPAPGEAIDNLVEDGSGRVWARTGSQLWRFEVPRGGFANIPTPIVLSAPVGNIAASGKNGLWVPNDAALLYWDGDHWTQLASEVYGSRYVLEDADGSIWVASRDLQRIVGRGIFRVFDHNEGVPGTIVWSVFRDSDRAFWIGTDDGLGYTDGRRFHRVPGTEGNAVRSIVQVGDELLIAGTPANVIYRVNRHTLKVAGEIAVNAKASKRIYRMALDHDGALWACTDLDGILKVDDPQSGHALAHVPIPEMDEHELVTDISIDAQGRLLAAANSGLYVLAGDRWHHFTPADGLLATHIAYARPLQQGGDWLVAYMEQANGISTLTFDGENIKVINSRRYSDRAADRVFQIAQDTQGAIWVGTGHGVDRIVGDVSTHYGTLDGIAGEDTASMAMLTEPNGDVWFGSVGGLTRYDAAHAASLPPIRAPRVDLQSLSIGGEAVDAAAGAIEVPSSRNWLEARLAAPTFLGNDPRQFKVQLGGVDLSPVVGSGFEVRYPALAPGTYHFSAAARVPPGDWGEPTTFELTVLSPWWETPLARVLAAMLLVLVVVGLVRVRTMRLQAQNTALELRVTARTDELRRANDELQAEIRERKSAEEMLKARNDELHSTNSRLAEAQQQLIQAEKMATVGQLAAGVAHEINNPIGFVQSNISTLSKYMDALWKIIEMYEAVEIEHTLNKSATEVLNAAKKRLELEYIKTDSGPLLEETADGIGRVRRIVEDLKNFSRLENPQWQSVDIHTCIESAIKLSAHEVKYKADVVRDYAETPEVYCLPFQLNQVFLNLLVNAAQAIPKHGTIRIATSSDVEGITIKVADDGAGIAKAELARVFDPFFTTKPIGQGTGLGLSVSYGIISRHRGRIEVDSEVGKGTEFRIWLPLDAREQDEHEVAII